PLVAEIYGPDYDGQIAVAQALRRQFETTPDIVDVDDSVEAPAKRLILKVDRQRAALLGVPQASVADTLDAALGGADVTYVHTGHEKHPVPVRVELPVADKASLDALLALEIRSASGALVPLSEVIRVQEGIWDRAIHHKDLLRVTYVTGDMAGDLDSPLYGMLALSQKISSEPVAGQRLDQHYIEQPENPYRYSVKWDGEWQITYETFRDMGIAYGVGLILIYLLVVAQFRSYLVPLVIMAPIPLTLLGVMPGHALLGAQFTATSMIGMIALAGIIVRNSILLVDFIQEDVARGKSLDETVIRAAAVRARPIILTGLAAMLGAFFILDDPIFSGLAVSLIFGILVSTALTLVVIPVLYYSVRYRSERPH
ncbi:MAG: efflux RND transporter permease subunit, partial [Betaproteobacteria bacterium]|nr:efflux RND transporter permease subunit [Betaproteobacteria bacterium]